MGNINLNSSGRRNAAAKISAGSYDVNSSWSFSAADGNAILGDPPDWAEYGRWHLGVRPDEDRETKAAWAYPFGKGGRVYRKALVAIRSRSSQQGDDAVFAAAGNLIDAIDAREESKMTTATRNDRLASTRIFVSRDEWAKRRERGEDGVAILKQFPVTVVADEKDVDPSTGMIDVEFILSTETVDREHDIIEVAGWNLDDYMRNPVVLWAHSYGQLPVGRAIKVWVADDGNLHGIVRFTPQDVNPFGYMVYQLVVGGFLNAVSVGFQPIEFSYNDDHAGYDFKRQDLLEFSVVPVPANPEALIAASAAGIDLAPLKAWAKDFQDSTDAADAAAVDSPATTKGKGIADGASVVETGIPTDTHQAEFVGYLQTEGVGDEPQGVVTFKTFGDDGGEFSAGIKWYTAEGEPLDEAPGPLDPERVVIHYGVKAHDETEELVEKAINDLRDDVRTLTGAVKTLTEAMTRDPEPQTDPDPDATATAGDGAESETTEDDVREIARLAVTEIMTARTGALPD